MDRDTPPSQDSGTLPSPKARTGYGTGDVPLAVTQEDFRVFLLVSYFRYDDPIVAVEWWDEHACCFGRREVYSLVLSECNLHRQGPPSQNDFWERSQVYISVTLLKELMLIGSAAVQNCQKKCRKVAKGKNLTKFCATLYDSWVKQTIHHCSVKEMLHPKVDLRITAANKWACKWYKIHFGFWNSRTDIVWAPKQERTFKML